MSFIDFLRISLIVLPILGISLQVFDIGKSYKKRHDLLITLNQWGILFLFLFLIILSKSNYGWCIIFSGIIIISSFFSSTQESSEKSHNLYSSLGSILGQSGLFLTTLSNTQII